MRILYSHRIGSRDGQGVHLEAMVGALRALGHEVKLVGPRDFDRAALGGESRWVGRLRRSLPRAVAELVELAYAAPAAWRLARAAAAFRPDVIYERANLYHLAGSLVARLRGVPLLLEVNAPMAEERGRFGGLALPSLAAWLERLVWRSASRALPVTEVLAGRLLAAGVARERVTVVPNGIHRSDFSDVGEAPARDPLVLGFVGFVREWHGLDAVLRGIAAWEGPPALSLVVVGEGPARPELERLARELGIADRVRFTGLAERAEIPLFIAGFDIALQPASVPYASPLKVFEYMAAGRAIVAPDQPNLREVLEHGRTALLFDPDAPGAFWRAVQRLAGSAPLRERIGEAARDEVLLRDLTWEGNARRVIAIAEAEIAASRRRGPRRAGLAVASRR
ncbi:glycosyltransferase family 1 protein [Roseococcus sp. SYP-B2431]|uniref:glycosyltransferase family 4 protein n=1 Tax=Roseococcus sp. SYP-B2431 TaxID=2496640 RepID=UPI00103CBA66|nr:glycosyltransferase family 4 protein [Roseococcus sp. SYP-B2431]TCH96305.1 glycosyltransferase family 1 protein [Roseococcus sp. SYP-B2431]